MPGWSGSSRPRRQRVLDSEATEQPTYQLVTKRRIAPRSPALCGWYVEHIHGGKSVNKYQVQRAFILAVAGGIVAFLALAGVCSLLGL